MLKAKNARTIIFGAICIYFAVKGIMFVIFYYIRLWDAPYDPETPYFHIIYPLMALANLIYFLGQFIAGMLYTNKVTKFWYIFPLSVLFYFLYDLFIYKYLHNFQEFSLSIAAATGVSGGGAYTQDQIYFWAWGSIICVLLHYLPLTSLRTNAQ